MIVSRTTFHVPNCPGVALIDFYHLFHNCPERGSAPKQVALRHAIRPLLIVRESRFPVFAIYATIVLSPDVHQRRYKRGARTEFSYLGPGIPNFHFQDNFGIDPE